MLQLVSSKQRISHILLCAPSDPAADSLAERLSQHLKFGEFIRLNASTRTFAEVPQRLMPHCWIDGDHFGLPPFSQLMAYKVVVVTCRDAAMLVSARLTNRDLFELEHGIRSAVHNEVPVEIRLHWDALVIDEAAQATEPEAAIPISVVAPPRFKEALSTNPLFVMAGDQMQLGPRAKTAALRTSLFERLFNTPLYKDHPLARNKSMEGAPAKPLDKTMLPITRPPFSNLVRNYRSHPAILAIPSALFYYDTLVPEASGTASLHAWTGWRGRRWPVLFKATTATDEMEGLDDGGGWYNAGEAHEACATAQSLMQSGLIQDERDICIMSPFSTQVRLLRSMMRNKPYSMRGVNIGPTEAFQGLEARAVILCTTRTRTRHLVSDAERGWGIVNERKRFNVALTRAKEGLIVIGNPHVLATDPCWAALLSFCRRHGLWIDCAEEAAKGERAPAAPAAAAVASSWHSFPSPGPGLDTGTVDSSGQWLAADSEDHASTLETGLVAKEQLGRDITSDYARFMDAGTNMELWVLGMRAAMSIPEDENESGEGDEQPRSSGDARGRDGSLRVMRGSEGMRAAVDQSEMKLGRNLAYY